jgi:Tfp pilus tip-associated adhesin PilY1
MNNVKSTAQFFAAIVCGLLSVVFASVSADAATQSFYIVASSGAQVSSVGPVTTNLANGNTNDASGSNGYHTTLFSKTSPTGSSNTQVYEDYSNTLTWYTLGRVYYRRAFGSAASLSAGVTGRFYLYSNKISDKYQFLLVDFDPATGTRTVISTSPEYNSPGQNITYTDVSFGNGAYTLPQGHYLAIEIKYRAGSDSNGRGRVYCNSSSYPSRIDAEIRFTVTSSAGTNGSITGPTVAIVDLDSTPSYTISASSGYNIQSLTVDGSPFAAAVGNASFNYTFGVTDPNVAIDGNRIINADFVVTVSTITISPGVGGSLSYPAGGMSWSGGTTSSYTYTGSGTLGFTATPDANYGIQEVYVNGTGQGVPQGQTTPYSFNITLPGTSSVSASFLRYYSVTLSAGAGGSFDLPSPQAVLSGQAITIDVIPDSGYRIDAITDNGNNVGNVAPYTITNVTTDHTVTASFLQTHIIHATAGPNGDITPVGDSIVDHGATRSFSITPNSGYRISDVLVDGTSVGAVSTYAFTNVTAPHTIEVSFVAAPIPSTYCAVPPYLNTPAPPNVMLMLSVETPMQGPANPNVSCNSVAPSSSSYSCSTSSSSCSSNGALGCYDNTREYYGYFESQKCYSYSGSGATGLFSPSSAATSHQCGGTAWSGNFLNWMSTTAVDAFRKAFTGGNRAVDTTTDTVLLAARLDSNGWFPDTVYIDNAQLYTPYSGTRYFKRENVGIGFGVCNASQTNCTITKTGSGEAEWPVASTNTEAVFSLRIKACDSTGGAENRCNSATNKPEGTIQKYMDKMRFALTSYVADSAQDRDGGVLRAPMKWVNPTIPNGMKYHDASGSVVVCSTSGGCQNPEREVETDGTFRSNPDGATGANSGIINYINKFAYSAGYKSHDPMGELYYEVVRYFRNLTPSVNNYCNGLTTSSSPTSFTSGDGFAYYCNATKTNKWGWRDPAIYPCSQNFVIAINDANPWLDKRIPGSAFTGSYGSSGTVSTDYCGSSLGACDTDFNVDVLAWTNAVGNKQGLTPGNLKVGCVWASGRDCTTAYNATTSPYTGMDASVAKYVTELGKVIGTYPSGTKYNSYNVAGLAYYAHMVDLRPDLAGSKHNLTTYMIDTQEPGGSMLVGQLNMLYLAAKFGGFVDMDNDQSVTIGSTTYNSPYRNTNCDNNSGSPNTYCAEWITEDARQMPDNYFFASSASKIEASLYKAFSNILNRATAGTAAAVANNRSGERGANVIQALFYPQWPQDKSINWLGDVQALWFYLDPLVQYSGIYEDSDQNMELNLDQDLIPGNDSLLVKALWKAGPVLHARAASSRSIYTLLDATQSLMHSNNSFTTANRGTLKPLLDLAALTDTAADAYINYVRGVDGGALRSRTFTYNSQTAAWKLGDIINSTPQIQGSLATNSYGSDYKDKSYSSFTSSNQYKGNNYVYVGANDGMLHAFRLGLVQSISDPTNKFRIAQIVDDTDLGKEEWAFIPKNALPYLKNCADAGYCHQYLVDGTPLVFDASLNKHLDCTTTNYWDCTRKTTLDASKNVDLTRTSWQSVLIGSMGHGGATRDGNCNETLNHDADTSNNSDCIKTPLSGNGYSSYFALDITTPLSPKFMWEFSDAVLPAADRGLGLTIPGPTYVRINPLAGTPLKPVKNSNGRWFAVFASGSTGPIDQGIRQMKGRSDQNLKLYVVDLNPFDTVSTGFVKCTAVGQTGCNYWVIDTGIKYAFANSLYKSTIDIDRADSKLDGWYSDDVVYVTYTKASLDVSNYPIDWDKGGVLRMNTKNDPDPANWFVSTLIDDIGPITSSVDILQDRNNRKLWLFFGEGRYFYTGDDLNATRRLFGVADPCYRSDYLHANTFYDTAGTCPSLTVAELKDQTTSPSTALTTEKGWYINLTAASGSSGAERQYGKLTATTTGVVYYPTLIPNSDICSSGGTTSLWAVKYNSGSTPPASGLKGKIIATTTSSPIPTAINLAGAFTRSSGRQLDAGIVLPGATGGGGGGIGGSGTMLRLPKPVKRIINMQER